MFSVEQGGRVLIVASGPSLTAVRPTDIANCPATIIAVNGSIEWLPRADYWFTLDDSEANIKRAKHRRAGVRYIMAIPRRRYVPDGVIRMERVQNNETSAMERLNPDCRGVSGLSEVSGRVHTGNSAYGALGIAYLMPNVRHIGLLGVDGDNNARVEGGKPNDLRHLPRLFASAVAQLDAKGIRVTNGSPNSSVTCFERVHPSELVRMMQDA